MNNLTSKILQNFPLIILLIIILKLFFSYVIPINSDEAYFYLWGQNLDINYYDHPPMTGWMAYLLGFIGKHVFFMRLITLITQIIIVITLFYFCKKTISESDNLEKSHLIILIFLLNPFHLFFIIFSTDIPLYLFIFSSGLFFSYGFKKEKALFFYLSGLFLGLAFLSKYLSFFMALGLFFSLLFINNKRKIFPYLICLILGVIPFVILHFYWISGECWWTIMFNIFNRTQNTSLSFKNFFIYLLFQVYIILPWVIYYFIKEYSLIKEKIKKDNYPFIHLFLFPTFLLGILSFLDVSIHWGLAYYPFLYFVLIYLPKSTLKKILNYTMIFFLFHLIIIFVIISLPLKTWKNYKSYPYLVMGTQGNILYQSLKKYHDDYFFGAMGYSTASLMSYHTNRHFLVFEDNDDNGRNDDKWTNFKYLNRKNILLISLYAFEKKEKENIAKYFDNIIYETINIKEANFYIVRGHNFNYNNYRSYYLKDIKNKFYNIPSFLPLRKCFFFKYYDL